MELWDVYDQHGNATGRVKSPDDIWNTDEFHLGISAWIVNSHQQILIQQRSVTKRVYPGHWSITCGSVKAGESSQDACIREVAEELGIHPISDDLYFIHRNFGPNGIYDDYLILMDISLDDIRMQPDEVSDIRWTSMHEIMQLYHQGQFMTIGLDVLESTWNQIGQHIVKMGK